ncbi:CLUMA_CG004858, isoform A [Clunio marinus]|uniref:Pyridoxal-dependent decarboxylase domain-containing protein 1 n=1 Tax=Clunio marinus TaxID=568069 RepID=A0A1J1HT42_9DIPT|nr:CLUMA_CG004858, isoform A [Clunio marinus]
MADQSVQKPSATEKIIMSSSKLISKLENLELLKGDTVPVNPSTNIEFLNEPRPAYEIFGNLEQLILFSDDDDDFFMPIVDDISHLAFVSQSVLSYIRTISPGTRLMKISDNIYNQTSKWLNSLFLKNSTATFLPSNIECLSKALRVALMCKFENYHKEGLQGVKSVSIYVNSKNPFLNDLKFVAYLVGLSESAIKVIASEDGVDHLNLVELNNQIETDKANNIIPLFLMADMGSSITGAFDSSLSELSEVSEKHQLWLHITGGYITSLAVSENKQENLKNVSSMTLDFEDWMGLPSVSYVLLHKQITVPDNNFFGIENQIRKIEAFPLWTVMQNLGRDRIVGAFSQAFQSCRVLYEMVSKARGFRLLSKNPSGDDDKDFFNATVVLFQFDGETSNDGKIEETSRGGIEKTNNSLYFDRLNSWLGQTLERDFPQLQLSLKDDKIFGTCIRYNPFELGVGEKVPSLETFAEFNEFFEAQSDILRATIEKKQVFNDLVENNKVLRLVKLNDDWAGLGGVHYVPEQMETIETDQGKTELNKLNMQLVERLKSSDNAFSLGESTDGVACIRQDNNSKHIKVIFGMVTSETDIEELLDLVVNAGNELQESSKVLDSMAEVIKKGIEAVETDLRKEADERVWNDGILRVVPVVGSVLNWINPLPKDGSGIKGRSLNLQQGVIESTENIYKYHMQLPLNKTSSTNHSRNGSQSSSSSKTVAVTAMSTLPDEGEPKIEPNALT